jgi:antitoxin (DNA-binding transcriptional repressor) of toxin-antitoxin stability system
VDRLRDRCGYLVDEAARGKHFLITRRGKALAKLVPAGAPLTLWPAAA